MSFPLFEHRVQGIADHLQFSASYKPPGWCRAEALAGYTWPSVANAVNDVLLSVCRTGRSRAAEETDVRGPASLPA